MTNFGWSLVEVSSQLLEGDEREAVLGDLVEAGESACRAVLDIVGLVFRLHAGLWRSWCPWLAGFGLSLPASLFLMGVSLRQPDLSTVHLPEYSRRIRNGAEFCVVAVDMQAASLDRLVLERWIRSGIDIAADRLDKRRFVLLTVFVLFGKLPSAIAFAVLPASVSPAGNLGSRSSSAYDSDETGFSHGLSFDHNVVDDPLVERTKSSLVEPSSLDSGCNADLVGVVYGRDGMAGGGNNMIVMRKALAPVAVIAFALLGGVTPLLAAPTASKVVSGEIRSGNFAHSKIDTSPIRKMVVYLPAGYDESPRRYPVIYFLPDAFGSYRNLFDHKDAQGIFDRAIAVGMIDKFILVAVDMNTSLGSSWCVNSPVTGNWEDFVVEELMPYMDANFKTLPRQESRGIAGKFMGGYCAIRLGMRHPDIFSSVYGLHPVGTGSGLKVMLSLPNWDLMANAKSLTT
jgi:Putative esterase